MNLNNPENVYPKLLKELFDIGEVNKNQACVILSEAFTKGTLPKQYREISKYSNLHKNKIILLDELDCFYTANQQLLYNLFEWPHHAKSHIIMIGIANTMDFPEKLKHKIASRIGNQRLVFHPYKSQ